MANTSGEKELKTTWDERTAADSAKAVGYTQNLIPDTCLVPQKELEGIY